MGRVLEYLVEEGDGAGRSFACGKCGQQLGSAEDYRDVAGSFDEPVNKFEPGEVNTTSETFVLRHHCCPSCGVLFEVEMVPVKEPEVQGP